MRRFFITCTLSAAFFGLVALVQAQDSLYVGQYYDVVKLDRRTQVDTLDVEAHLRLPTKDDDGNCSDNPRLFVDSNDDNKLKFCNGTEWKPIAIDSDEDGFVDDIDGSPNTAASGYDDPVFYRETTAYNNAAILAVTGSIQLWALGDARQRCNALAFCLEAGEAGVVSWTTGQRTNRGEYDICDGSPTVGQFNDFISDSPGVDITAFSNTSSGDALETITCYSLVGT